MKPIGFVADAEFDFHLLGPLTGYDIEIYLDRFLEDSHIAGHDKLLLVTGKGAVVRPKVQQLLSRHKLVKSFKHAGYFNGQDGAFEVILKG